MTSLLGVVSSPSGLCCEFLPLSSPSGLTTYLRHFLNDYFSQMSKTIMMFSFLFPLSPPLLLLSFCPFLPHPFLLLLLSDPERPPILSVSQDWVPILDKVFGQKWCNEIRELEGGGGRGLGEGRAQQVQPLSTPPLTLEPSPSSPQQDPRWTPLEDMEVFSPDDEVAESHRSAAGGPSSGPGDLH